MTVSQDHIYADTIGNRPAFGFPDKYFWATDEHILYRDTGAAWEKVGYDEGARVYHTPGQTIGSGAGAVLAFNSERYDTDSIHNNSIEGTADNLRAGELEDTSKDFAALGVAVGWAAWNKTDATSALVNDVTNAAAGRLGLDTDIFDTGNEDYSVTLNPSRLTCKTAGKYHISATISWAADALGYRQILFRLNGATIIAIDERISVGASSMGQHLDTQYNLGVNDYVEVMVYQNSGNPVIVNTLSNYSPEFMMQRIG